MTRVSVGHPRKAWRRPAAGGIAHAWMDAHIPVGGQPCKVRMLRMQLRMACRQHRENDAIVLGQRAQVHDKLQVAMHLVQILRIRPGLQSTARTCRLGGWQPADRAACAEKACTSALVSMPLSCPCRPVTDGSACCRPVHPVMAACVAITRHERVLSGCRREPARAMCPSRLDPHLRPVLLHGASDLLRHPGCRHALAEGNELGSPSWKRVCDSIGGCC